MKEKKVKFREWEVNANEMMPITEEKVRSHCGKPAPKSYYQKFTISIAPRELRVTICEKHTAAELEHEIYMRGKIDTMHFAQLPTGNRGNGNLQWKTMP